MEADFLFFSTFAYWRHQMMRERPHSFFQKKALQHQCWVCCQPWHSCPSCTAHLGRDCLCYFCQEFLILTGNKALNLKHGLFGLHHCSSCFGSTTAAQDMTNNNKIFKTKFINKCWFSIDAKSCKMILLRFFCYVLMASPHC